MYVNVTMYHCSTGTVLFTYGCEPRYLPVASIDDHDLPPWRHSQHHTILELVGQDKVKEEEEDIIIEEEEQKPALSPEEEERSMHRAESSMGVSLLFTTLCL